jgi:excinuclease ABC subunit B
MFKLTSKNTPKGDQVNAIKQLVDGLKNKEKSQVLLGATGTGKTFTIANVIQQTKKKTLIIVHNKTLAGQLYSEFKELFPENKIEYFVSYFDFFQPEAYIPRTDTYVEKNAQSNQEIEMLRLSTINSTATADDVIVIASVAAIYASASPDDFNKYRIILSVGQEINQKQFLYDLVRLQYQNNSVSLTPGNFRVIGDTIEIAPGLSDMYTIRISFDGDTIEEIATLDVLTKNVIKKYKTYAIAPANEYITNSDHLDESLKRIKDELVMCSNRFKEEGKFLEEQRITERTNHDIESIKELGYCNGIENYASHLELRSPNQTPYTLFDYFKNNDWLLVIDESHMTVPQIRGMYNTDRSRKETLVKYGFRLPSALDNRPLNFDEFLSKTKQVIYVSATPNE